MMTKFNRTIIRLVTGRREHSCKYGHLECSTVLSGPCFEEVLSQLTDEEIDAIYQHARDNERDPYREW
jgi:hypothetical protein